MRDNKTKVITMAALVIAIIGLSIGFAAFSSTLNIQTGANINPTDNFSVKFSKEDTSLVENQSVLPTEASTATGDSATINNQNNPKISGLSAHFTQPGQKVVYEFYVRNMGPYDAYLTDVRFNNANGGTSFKKCEATGSNPVSNANDMCEYITFKLELAGLATPLTPSSEISSIIGNNYVVNKSLTPESGNTNSKLVKVTIEYPDGSPYADGSFNVSFGSVEMVFASLAGYVPPVQATATSEELNPWITRGLTSPNIVFNKTYTTSEEDPGYILVLEDLTIYSNGGIYKGEMNADSAAVDGYISAGPARVGLDYIIFNSGWIVELFVFESQGTMKYYYLINQNAIDEQSGVEFTKTGIIGKCQTIGRTPIEYIAS